MSTMPSIIRCDGWHITRVKDGFDRILYGWKTDHHQPGLIGMQGLSFPGPLMKVLPVNVLAAAAKAWPADFKGGTKALKRIPWSITASIIADAMMEGTHG